MQMCFRLHQPERKANHAYLPGMREKDHSGDSDCGNPIESVTPVRARGGIFFVFPATSRMFHSILPITFSRERYDFQHFPVRSQFILPLTFPYRGR